MFAIDFHIHTASSFDSLTPPRAVIEVARRRGLNGIAITDHDTVRGAFEAIKANPYSDFLIIPGIEVKSDAGDVIGLFVREDIQSRKLPDVIAEIHDQGGLAYMPHPIRTFGADQMPEVHACRSDIDLWERYNGRYDGQEIESAGRIFDELNVNPSLCGSDAHFPWEVGIFRTLLSGVPSSPQALLELSRSANLQFTPRNDMARRTGITLGAMIKDLKRKRYAKLGTLAATLPWKLVRRSLFAGLERLRG